MHTLLEHLERSRNAFLKEVDGVSPGQAAARASGEVWSILDVVEHIATVDIGVVEVLKTRLFVEPCPPEYKAKTFGKDQFIVDVMKDRATRRISPDLVKPAGRWPTMPAALDAFVQARNEMIDLLKLETRNLRDFCAPHPSLKSLDGHQWILFVISHTDRHREQISELKSTF
jgi:hypothetical protein